MALLKDLTVYGASRFIGDAFGTYIYATLFNTSDGDMGNTAFSRVYVSNDSFIRWKSKTDFIAEIRDNGGFDSRYVKKEGDIMTGALKRYYSTASNDPMIALTSNNLDVWLWRINHGESALSSTSGVYGFGLKYLGSLDGNNNKLVLYSDAQNGTQVAAMSMQQDGKITLSIAPNAPGYIKDSSDDNHVLLGAGGHKEWSTTSSANTLVARDSNKDIYIRYAYATLFNTSSGDMGDTAFSRIYVSNDNFIKWQTKSKFAVEMRDSGYMDGRWVLKTGDTMTGDLSMSNNEIQNVNNLYINNQILFSSSIDIKYPSSGSTSGRILMSDSDGIDISSNASKKINIHTNSNEIDISSSGFYVNANGDDMIRLSNTGSSNYINGNTNLIIYGGSNGSISFKSSSPGINYNKATWVENLKSLIINSGKSIEMYGSGGNCYFYAGTDGNPYKMEIGSYGVSYIKFDKTGIADFYGEVRFRDAVTFKGIATHEKDVLPSNNNGKNLGSSSYRWKKLYIGTADSYGTSNKPIYWNNGAPAECNYSLNATVNSGTSNRIAYYSGANAISSGLITSDGTYLGNVNYLSINTAHQTNYRLYVNGNSYFTGQITSTVANGTAPFVITSETRVSHLNADLLDGYHATDLCIEIIDLRKYT